MPITTANTDKLLNNIHQQIVLLKFKEDTMSAEIASLESAMLVLAQEEDELSFHSAMHLQKVARRKRLERLNVRGAAADLRCEREELLTPDTGSAF